jgi:cell division protein FtsL
MKKLSKSAKVAGLILIILISGSIFTTITYSSKGSELVSIENQISDVDRENREIKTKIIKESSLTKLGDSAEQMKMIEPENIVYLSYEKLDLSYANSN